MTKRPDLDIIGSLLADVQEQYLEVKSSGDSPDPLALELLEATVQFMGANISVFRRSLQSPVEAQTEEDQNEVQTEEDQLVEDLIEAPIVSEVEFTPEIVYEPEPEFEPEPEPEPEFEPEPEYFVMEDEVDYEDAEIEEEIIEEEEAEFEEEIIEEDDEEIEIDFSQRQSPAEDLFDTPSRPLSINEMMANQMRSGTSAGAAPTGVPNRNEQAKISDLKSAISLNDKLLFIKDLFNGYSLAYSEAIELLNRYDSLEEADEFLQTNYAVKNQWANRQETTDKLYAILKRRYS